MRTLPQPQTLTSQTVAILRAEIARGAWPEFLPGERLLCEKLQISRNTLRAALAHLQREQLLRAKHGVGYRILRGPAKPGGLAGQAGSRDVALLTSEPLHRLRPNQTLWIDELRAMLGEHESRLHVFHGAAYFRPNPGPALRQLVARHPHRCWILVRANATTQAWFSRSRVPCIVAGSIHAGLKLPFRDLDYRAVCRHAAGVLFGLGHRRIALITPHPSMAGDLEGETGWLEAARQSRHPGAEALLGSHDSTVAGIGHVLRRLLGRKLPPTALVVTNPYHYLTVTSQLTQLGRRVPADLSVISRDDEVFLSYLVPTPARYVANPNAMSRTLLRPVLELLAGRPVTEPELKLMPEFLRGESLGPPAGR